MMLRKTVAIAAMVIGTMGVASGTTYAEPAAPEAEGINYETKLVDKTIVTTIDAGSFDIRDDGQTVALEDAAGNTVLSLPLSFSMLGTSHPYTQEVSSDGKVLSLTPDMDPAKARPAEVKPVASLLENQRAQDTFATQFGLATAIGGFTGTALGVAVGAVTGCILGLPLLGVGCIPAAIAGAGIGGILGTVAIGGPALLIAGVDLVQTLVAPPGTTKWNYPVINPK